MSVKCQVVMEAMEKIAPRRLAESWDNVGLMTGSPSQAVQRIMVALDADAAAVERAAALEVDLLITHHPLVFQPLKHLRADLPQGRLLADIIRNNLAVFSAHTNLDTADGGVNDVLAEALELRDIMPLAETYREPLVKLVVFVPPSHADAVQEAIGKAGAGHIGGYSHCSFRAAGQGSFLPLEGARPFIGAVGQIETVTETRLETILPEKILRRVVKAMLAAHPYEEAAYDLYPLKNTGKAMGLGRIGRLAQPLDIAAFAKQVGMILPANGVRFVRGGGRMVKKVALCGGSGAEFIVKAAYAGADVLVTGDVKYHEAQKAMENGIHVVDAGHFGTEALVVRHLARRLEHMADQEGWQVDIIADAGGKDPFEFAVTE